MRPCSSIAWNAAVPGNGGPRPHLRQALAPLRRSPRSVYTQADDALRTAERGRAWLHAFLLEAPVAQVFSHLPLHEASFLRLGHVDPSQLAKGRPQQGIHGGAP